MEDDYSRILKELSDLSDHIYPEYPEVSIILAAGHGKRIKSEKSKMLHEIWGKPSVWRVSEAALRGLSSPNQIIVVGKKAIEVAHTLGKRTGRVFVYQEEQKGTGDAVSTAVRHQELSSFKGNIYIFPGDMGLLSDYTVRRFKETFTTSQCDMLVMTGMFEGKPDDNYYGRIIKTNNNNSEEIIEIKEFKDILALDDKKPYKINFRGNELYLTKEELLSNREFNAGVYAFKIGPLLRFINKLKPDNIQGEIYITDLIKIFNDQGLKVCTSPVKNSNLVVAFNVKSVLKKMEGTFREMVYEKLKDIITIHDSEDFFIAEETIKRIIELDARYPALDITVGKGAYIGENINVNRGLTVERNASLMGNVQLGENVTIGENVILSTYPQQTMVIGDNTIIFRGNVIQGNIKIGKNVRIETGVRITGSDEDPVVIGDDVLIKGMTYIYGSVIENDLLIEHSILKKKYVEKVVKKNGQIQPVKYILPHPEGLDSISDIR